MPVKKKGIHKKIEKNDTQALPMGLSMVKGMAVAYAVTCIFFIAYGLILTYTDISEESLPMVSLICSAVSAAVCGYDWGRLAKKKGLLWGLLAGVVYTLLLFIVTFLANDSFSMGMSKVITLLTALAGGGIGGILGVNRKK